MPKKPPKKTSKTPAKRSKRRQPDATNPYGLDRRQWKFCEHLVVHENVTQAAIQAGFRPAGASVTGSRLLGNAKVQRALQDLREARSKRLEIKADGVLRRWIAIADADPNELIEMRRVCCRHCHGTQFRYQRTQAEMRASREVWQELRAKATPESPVGPFDVQGGDGYDGRRPPHPQCPECFGEGVAIPFPRDTRNLSEGARRLYAGLKVTRDGIEIKMRDQDAALLNIAKHLGMLVNKSELSGPGGKAIAIEIVGMEIVPPDERTDTDAAV